MDPDHVADALRAAEVPWDDLRSARVQRRVLEEVRRPPRRRSRRGGVLAIAASLTMVVMLILVWRWPTTPASHALLELADGSIVVQREAARVVAEVVDVDAIQVRQTGGLASYDVTPRPERRFVVFVRNVRIEVLGTAFDVDARDGSVRVAVQRGRVQVTRGDRDVVLGAGDELVLRDDEPEARRSPEDTRVDDEPAVDPPYAPPSATASGDAAPSASSAPAAPPAAELFRAADDARAAGNTAEALRLLHLLVETHPRDPRVTMAMFTIGRLEAQRGRHATAAAAFESCGNALRGEALAEAALAHAASGNGARARALALQYRQRFPEGPRSRELERLAR